MPQSLQKAYEDTLIVDDEMNNLMQLEEEQGYWAEVNLGTLYKKACKELSRAELDIYMLRDAEAHIAQEESPCLMSKITHLKEEIENIIDRAYKEEGIILTHPHQPRLSLPSLVTRPEL